MVGRLLHLLRVAFEVLLQALKLLVDARGSLSEAVQHVVIGGPPVGLGRGTRGGFAGTQERRPRGLVERCPAAALHLFFVLLELDVDHLLAVDLLRRIEEGG